MVDLSLVVDLLCVALWTLVTKDDKKPEAMRREWMRVVLLGACLLSGTSVHGCV